jgi:hypothetical protein
VGLVALWLVTGWLIPVVDIIHALKIDAPASHLPAPTSVEP